MAFWALKKIVGESVPMPSVFERPDNPISLGQIVEQLSKLDGIAHRAMMGEYVIYYRGKVAGGIYDDRFLAKPTKSVQAMMPDASRELPYGGAKEMLLVEDVENKEFLKELLEAMYDELPAPEKSK